MVVHLNYILSLLEHLFAKPNWFYILSLHYLVLNGTSIRQTKLAVDFIYILFLTITMILAFRDIFTRHNFGQIKLITQLLFRTFNRFVKN